MTAPERVAIVGSGISGLICAYLLDSIHDVVLYEADDRLGGHTNTVTVEDPLAGRLGIDTGFIVHNDRNYPNLIRLLTELGVATIDSEMSFAVTDRPSGFTYRATSVNTLLARRRNVIDTRLWRMVLDILRFHRNGRQFLANPSSDETMTIAQFLTAGRYSRPFVDLHLVPMGAAVWSADPSTFDRFPAMSLLRFLDNHGLLSIGNRPQWKTIAGGSRTYVDAIAARLRGSVRLGDGVEAVTRTPEGVTVVAANSHAAHFAQVILATHSDQALAILTDPTALEKELLGAVRYQPNRATLHTDISLLSPNRRAWAAWNYERLDDTATTAGVTYDLSNLQRLPGSRRYLVSLNAEDRVDPATVLAEFDYAHPVFDIAAIAAQRRIAEINGVANTWFCGAWQGYGFHEDGISSGIAVAQALGATW